MATQNSRAAGGGVATKAQDAPREETIDGRIVVFQANEDPFFKDNGEPYIAEKHKAMQALTLGRSNGEAAWKQIRKLEPANPSILFWVPEYMGGTDQDPQLTKNPIRGLPLVIFEKPAVLRRGDKPNPNGVMRKKWCAFFLLTDSCRVKNRDKKVIEAKAGAVVWVDLPPAISTEIRKKFAPKTVRRVDEKTGLESEHTVQLFEVAIDPKFKQPFTFDDGSPGNVWRMNLYRINRPTIGIDEIKQIKAFLNAPSVPGDDDDMDEMDMDALFEDAPPALPAAASGDTSSTAPSN